MFPVNPDHRVIYSSIVESFGITRTNCATLETFGTPGELCLTDLPFEVLRTIAGYLDGFRYYRSLDPFEIQT